MSTTDKAKRMQRKLNELGRNPSCQICGEPDITVLTSTNKTIFEEHHVCGNHEDETVVVCRNCHAKLTDDQLDWPSELFDDNRNPEIKAIGFFLGLAAILGFLATLCVKYAYILYDFIENTQEGMVTLYEC